MAVFALLAKLGMLLGVPIERRDRVLVSFCMPTLMLAGLLIAKSDSVFSLPPSPQKIKNKRSR